MLNEVEIRVMGERIASVHYSLNVMESIIRRYLQAADPPERDTSAGRVPPDDRLTRAVGSISGELVELTDCLKDRDFSHHDREMDIIQSIMRRLAEIGDAT